MVTLISRHNFENQKYNQTKCHDLQNLFCLWIDEPPASLPNLPPFNPDMFMFFLFMASPPMDNYYMLKWHFRVLQYICHSGTTKSFFPCNLFISKTKYILFTSARGRLKVQTTIYKIQALWAIPGVSFVGRLSVWHLCVSTHSTLFLQVPHSLPFLACSSNNNPVSNLRRTSVPYTC